MFICGLLACVGSCGNKGISAGQQTVRIDLNDRKEATELFAGYEYIPLETNGDNLIGQIDKIQIDSVAGRIYVMERKEMAVFIFDLCGKSVGKVQKPGRAPEEYPGLEDFVAFHSEIYCLSRMKKLNVYSEKGDFLRSHDLDDWYSHFTILNDSLMYLFSENANHKHFNFILYDYKNDRYVREFDRFGKNQNYLFSLSPFQRTGSGLMVVKQFDNTVYDLNSDSIVPHFNIEFNTPDRFPDNYRTMDTGELLQKLKGKSLVRRIDYVYCTGNRLWLVYQNYDYDLGYRDHITCVDLISNTVKTYRLGDRLYAEFPGLMNPVAFCGGHLVTYVPAVALCNMDLSSQPLAKDSIRETDNPVLFLNKLK